VLFEFSTQFSLQERRPLFILRSKGQDHSTILFVKKQKQKRTHIQQLKINALNKIEVNCLEIVEIIIKMLEQNCI